MMSTVVDILPTKVRIGQRVRTVVQRDQTPPLLVFTPVGGCE